MSTKGENFPGNAVLIMLFILGFPLLRMSHELDGEVGPQDSHERFQEASVSSRSNTHRSIDVGAQIRRAWTPLAPQDISLMILHDYGTGTVSLILQYNGADSRFIWQDWVDAAMGCMKGFEERKNSRMRYGRKVVRTKLGKEMVELFPLRFHRHGIEVVVERTSTARVWTGWPVLDVRICEFEVDRWVNACNFNFNLRNRRANELIETVDEVIGGIISADSEEV